MKSEAVRKAKKKLKNQRGWSLYKIGRDWAERVALGEVSFSRALDSVPSGARIYLRRCVARLFNERGL